MATTNRDMKCVITKDFIPFLRNVTEIWPRKSDETNLVFITAYFLFLFFFSDGTVLFFFNFRYAHDDVTFKLYFSY